MSKITNIPSEISNFFSEKRRSIVMDTFTRLLESLNLDNRSLGGLKRENCQLTNLQVFQILLLLPFFAIKGFSHYDGSALCRILTSSSCHPKALVKEFSDFLMSCHQHCLGVNLLVQR